MENPCTADPCGPNSECRNVGGVATCSCLHSGSPPRCGPSKSHYFTTVKDRSCETWYVFIYMIPLQHLTQLSTHYNRPTDSPALPGIEQLLLWLDFASVEDDP